MCLPNYESKSDHRIPNWNKNEKSKWIITTQKEQQIFLDGYTANWFEEKIVWSLSAVGNTLETLGEDHRPRYVPKGKKYTELVIAKFVEHRENYWHGYPVNVLTDSPCSEVFKVWSQTPGIPKRSIMKLNKAR
ncbi:hypothetical protein [Pantoea ananatis]|uniref:hypothetical protein n=1 Tax=Pantoea ananas TaxID=553 RepID=UPI001B306F5C|nr:hypothetical protein [Pantoea ananatis]